MRINIVTLGVEDLERSEDFYERLGWRLSDASNPAISFLESATGVGPTLALFPYDALASDAQIDAGGRESFGGITLAINVTSREEVEGLLNQAEGAGATIIKAAAETDWGGYSGYFADPDGYPWEVAHNPFFAVREDGSLDLTPPQESDEPS